MDVKLVCEHARIIRDEFARLPGVVRATPGDCLCYDCGELLPLDWNGGRPRPLNGGGKYANWPPTLVPDAAEAET